MEGELYSGMREVEDAETMEVTEDITEVISIAGAILETGAVGEDFQIVEVMDIRGPIMWGAMVAV